MAAALGLVVAACGGSDAPGADASPPGGSSSSETPSSGASDEAERSAVEQVYRQFWTVTWNLDRRYPRGQWRRVLSQVAVDPALTQVLAAADVHRRDGITLYGQVTARITDVTFPNRDHAKLIDCQDASAAGQASVATGERKTVGVARSPVSAVLVRGKDGRWRISQADYTGGTC